MSKSISRKFDSELKIQINRIILPPIINADFSDISPVNKNPISSQNSLKSSENKIVKKSSILENKIRLEQKAIDKELEKLQRISLKIGQVIEKTHNKLENWKSLSPRVKDDSKKLLVLRSSVNSPTGSMAFLNKQKRQGKVIDGLLN